MKVQIMFEDADGRKIRKAAKTEEKTINGFIRFLIDRYFEDKGISRLKPPKKGGRKRVAK